jgi:cell division protein DivIC
LHKLIQILKNRYFIVGATFIVWMSFFDPKDWGLIYDRKTKLQNLENTEAELKKKISQTKNELNSLKSSALTVERYAREKYMMKKDNEDLFIVQESE